MATIPEITDRLEAATEKAENASQIMYDVANGDATTEVPTASGPTPTLKKWFQDLGSSVEPMLAGIPERLDKSILKYADYAAASSAASSLPDNQAVISPDLSGVLTAWETLSGNLVEVGKIEIDVTQFGARTSNTSAQNLVAFLAAKAEAGDGGVVYVPSGVWNLTNPFDLGERFFMFGRGAVLRFDQAEWRRRGGSTGTLRTSEQYTLYYEHTGVDADITVTINNGPPVAWSWFAPNVIDVPAAAGTTSADVISYSIAGGRHRLGPVPEDVNGYCMDSAGGSVMQTAFSPTSVAGGPGYNNYRAGSRAGYSLLNGGNNTYWGTRAGASNVNGGNNVAGGYQALYRNQGNSCTVLGTIAMEWSLDMNDCLALGEGALGSALHGSANVVAGNGALTAQTANSCTVSGHNAMNRIGYARTVGSVTATGAYAANYHWGSNNCYYGYASGRGEVDPTTGTDNNNGSSNAWYGNFSGSKIGSGSYNAGFGDSALLSLKTGSNATAAGHRAAASTTVGEIAAFGTFALEESTTAIRQSAFGFGALRKSNGNDNSGFGFSVLGALTSGTENDASGTLSMANATTASGNTTKGSRAGQNLTTGSFNYLGGRRAGQNLTDGSNNCYVGADAGRLKQDGTNNTSFTGTTAVGNDSRVSGNNQVQLGASGTTTYAYGAVQDRSDSRDKADVRDTVLGLDFIKDLRAVDFRWDMRDDYVETLSRIVEREVVEEVEVPTGLLDANQKPIMRIERITRVISETVDEVVHREKDGSKKRSRFHHGLIAQQVREVMERHGVDFGGFQDHSINGGCDVLSIGYTELIAPLIKAVQEISDRVKELESR